jgi:pimeloyl-ACP methyl ester carboxylesterase
MDALGHQRFAVVGHDTGMVIAYALAADRPDRVDRLAVAEAPLPGVAPSPPLLVPGPVNDRLWHIAFNRLAEVNEQLVRGREDIYFGYEFATAPAKNCPTTPSGSTSTPSPPTLKPCAAASVSTRVPAADPARPGELVEVEAMPVRRGTGPGTRSALRSYKCLKRRRSGSSLARRSSNAAPPG